MIKKIYSNSNLGQHHTLQDLMKYTPVLSKKNS